MLEMSGSMQFPPHLHSHLELTICQAGAVGMTIDGYSEVLHAGDIALACPHTVHSYDAVDDGSTGGVMLLVDPFWLPDLGYAFRTMHAQSPFLRGQALHPDCAYAIDAILREQRQAQPEEAACRALLGLLLVRLAPQLVLRPQAAHGPVDLMHRALAYLAENYMQSVTLQSTAKALGVNAHHLSHVFSARLGMGYHAYVSALRINQAEMLLRGSDLSITRICFDCGFDSQRTFNRLFQNAHGMTPRAFRKAGMPSSR